MAQTSCEGLCIHNKLKPTPQKDSSTRIEDDLQQVLVEAHRCEAEICENLQLRAGGLALEESKNPIELSSLQIEEGKRRNLKRFERRGLLANGFYEDL